jgi:hypothetical protein
MPWRIFQHFVVGLPQGHSWLVDIVHEFSECVNDIPNSLR